MLPLRALLPRLLWEARFLGGTSSGFFLCVFGDGGCGEANSGEASSGVDLDLR